MRTRRPSPEHQEAVSRRLAQLSAELASARAEPRDAGGDELDDGRDDGGAADDELDAGPAWAAPHTRVRPVAPWPPAQVPQPPVPPSASGSPRTPVPEPVVVPVVGRHAARRPRRLVQAAVPETLRGRIALGPVQLAVIALVVAAGLAVTCWWVVRADSPPVSAPTTSVTT